MNARLRPVVLGSALLAAGLALSNAGLAQTAPGGKANPPGVGLRPFRAPDAGPAPVARLTGQVTWTGASGDTGVYQPTLSLPNGDAVLKSIEWDESGDRPCRFSATLSTQPFFSAVADTTLTPSTTNWCGYMWGDTKRVDRQGFREAVTALQVCLTDKNDSSKDRLKGIRVWGRVWDEAAGTLGPENGPDEAKQAHCADWSQKVSCAAGQVATQLRVYAGNRTGAWDPSKPNFARGLALGCRPIAKI